VTVKLQRRLSSGSYKGFSGTVKCYRANEFGEYVYVMKRYGSTMTFPLPQRGKYKFRYAGSSTKKPCTAYSTVKEDIGFVIDAHGPVVTPVEGSLTQKWMTLTYTVNWNTNAWNGGAWVGSDMSFGFAAGVWCYYERLLQEPGDVEFAFKLDESEITSELYEGVWAYVDPDADPYIVYEEEINEYPMNP
jgi:hypothetical protein